MKKSKFTDSQILSILKQAEGAGCCDWLITSAIGDLAYVFYTCVM